MVVTRGLTDGAPGRRISATFTIGGQVVANRWIQIQDDGYELNACMVKLHVASGEQQKGIGSGLNEIAWGQLGRHGVKTAKVVADEDGRGVWAHDYVWDLAAFEGAMNSEAVLAAITSWTQKIWISDRSRASQYFANVRSRLPVPLRHAVHLSDGGSVQWRRPFKDITAQLAICSLLMLKVAPSEWASLDSVSGTRIPVPLMEGKNWYGIRYFKGTNELRRSDRRKFFWRAWRALLLRR